MFPLSLLEERITWDEFVKRKGWKPDYAFQVYRVIKYKFKSRNQELPDGVAYFSEKGWNETVQDSLAWWKRLTDLTFEDWA